MRTPVASAPGFFIIGADALKKVSCYIDGFNLYHAIDALGHEFNYLKWLNLYSHSSAFIIPSKETLTASNQRHGFLRSMN
jgi:hypothetical protein